MDTLTGFIKKGLYAMADSANSGEWFLGHVGATIISIVFFIKNNNVSDRVHELAIQRINDILNDNEFTLQEAPEEQQTAITLKPLIEAVEVNIENFSTSGHGVIFGAIALNAINYLGNQIPTSYIQKIADVVMNAQDDSSPNRFWSVEDYKTADIDLTSAPDFANIFEAAKYCIANQKKVRPNVEYGDRFYYFQGSRLHQVTHAHALVLLHKLGYEDLAYKGLHSIRKQIVLCNLLPKDVEHYIPKKTHYPFEPEFWETMPNDLHYYKLTYSAYDLFKHMNQEDVDGLLENINIHWDYYSES